MKNTITKNEYQRIIGIQNIAKKYTDVLELLAKDIGEIIGEEDWIAGHSSDLCYGVEQNNLDEWLRVQEIKIID